MAMITRNDYFRTHTGTSATDHTWTSPYYDPYRNVIIDDSWLKQVQQPAKPKISNFEEKLQEEIDDWLSIFK